MITKFRLCLNFLIIILTSNYYTFGQSYHTANNTQKVLDFVKEVYGSSDLLINGVEYIPEDPRIYGTPNLFSESWLNADIYIKGESFPNCKVKYNILTDQLVLKFHTKTGIQRGVVLDNKLVDSIRINNHMLLSAELLRNNNLKGDFAEYLKVANASIYIEYYKDHIKFYTESQPYGKFSDTKRIVHLRIHGHVYDVTKKRSFLKLFPEKHKDMRKYLRKNNIRFLNADVDNFKELLKINE